MDDNSIIPKSINTVEIILKDGDSLTLLEPESLIMYEGNPENIKKERIKICDDIDRRILLAKNAFTKTTIEGAANLVISLPREFFITIIKIEDSQQLLYNFKDVIFYTKNISFYFKIIKIKEIMKAIATGSLVFTGIRGNGYVGIFHNAKLFKKDISISSSVLVNKNSIIAFPESAHVKLIPVGNKLHAHTTKLMCSIRGSQEAGEYILYQGANIDFASQQLQSDNIFKRFIKEFVPGTSTIWK